MRRRQSHENEWASATILSIVSFGGSGFATHDIRLSAFTTACVWPGVFFTARRNRRLDGRESSRLAKVDKRREINRKRYGIHPDS